jgi:anti-sigma factor RsiW
MTTMDCDDLVELVTAYLDEALDAETQRRVVDHLNGCDGCQTYVAQIRATIRSVGQLAPVPVDPATRDRLLEAFRKYSG